MITHIQDFKTTLGSSYGDFVRNLFRPLPPSSMLAHAAMGVVTEIQELEDADTLDNSIEECGDIAFFCAAFQQSLPVVVSNQSIASNQVKVFLDFCEKREVHPKDFDNLVALDMALVLSIEMLDAAKRWLAYDKAPDAETCTRLAASAELVGQIVMSVSVDAEGHLDPQAVIDVNVAKLQHRYKGGFSTEAAVNRDVASELKAIQDELAP